MKEIHQIEILVKEFLCKEALKTNLFLFLSMPPLAFQKHQQELMRLYESKPLHIFDIADLEKIVHSFGKIFVDAVERKAVYPYHSTAEGVFNQLAAMRENLAEFRQKNPKEIPLRTYSFPFHPRIFNFLVAHQEIPEALQAIYPLICRTRKQADALSEVNDAAESSINYEIKPNRLVGEKYLAEARFLVPVSVPEEGVFAFTVHPKKDAASSSPFPLMVEQTTNKPYSNLGQALKKETDMLRLETVVVAKGTEQYSLPETVIPLLIHRYLQKLVLDG